MGVSGGCALSVRRLSVMTSLPARESLIYFAGTWWGFFDSANLKTNKDRFGVCFLFPPLCPLQTPSASPATQIWYGAFGTGLSGARYVSVTLFFNARSAWSCRQQLGLGLSGNFCDVHTEYCSSVLSSLSWFCMIICAHLCHNGEFLQPCRTVANVRRHACAPLFTPSPKKALYLTYFPLIMDLGNIRFDC